VKTPHSSWAQHFDEAYRRSFRGFYDELTQATVECVARIQPSPARVVDFGAGTGRLALPLAQAGYSVVAIDPCAEMLAVLSSKAEKERLTIPTVCCRMQDEFQSPPFDIALCVFTVLLYLLDEAALNASFQTAAGALRPGGRLLLDIPSRQIFHSYNRTAPDFVREVRVIPETEVLFRCEETIRVLDGDGWVDHADSFQIRYWEQSLVFDALGRAGFVMEDDLSAQFAGSGSNYYLASRLPRT
jgi:SAM-dependent methyltransferase